MRFFVRKEGNPAAPQKTVRDGNVFCIQQALPRGSCAAAHPCAQIAAASALRTIPAGIVTSVPFLQLARYDEVRLTRVRVTNTCAPELVQTWTDGEIRLRGVCAAAELFVCSAI